MSRSLRASAAAAAKKISAQAVDDDGDVHTEDVSVRTRLTAKKRKREESPAYDEKGFEEVEEDSDSVDDDDYDDDDDDDNDDNLNIQKQRARKPPSVPTALLIEVPVVKKQKKVGQPRTSNKEKADMFKRLFSASPPGTGSVISRACCPPERLHGVDYHRPLLLDGATGRAARGALLAWYDGVSAARGMPWRKPWVHPDAYASSSGGTTARDLLAQRAYEVWISEVMAQQTRIAVVVGYWTRWMSRWPTVADLAAAPAHEVTAQWAGLGYYSRAARLHQAAKLVVADPKMEGLLPADVATLEARVPGVGRYTAGAISAIVFGRAAAMVDGNVIRVLSRQLGLFADSKADKALVDLLWAAAEALVEAVARDNDGAAGEDDVEASDPNLPPPLSDRPGRWGQALMELGSTVCAPKPDCGACPIRSTCRAYAEGLLLYDNKTGRGGGSNLEPAQETAKDVCHLCEQFPELEEDELKDDNDDDDDQGTGPPAKKKKTTKSRKAKQPPKPSETRSSTSPFFSGDIEDSPAGVSPETLVVAVHHAKVFPLRRPKKPVREVTTLVCAMRVQDGRYLLQQRPAKGLLAGLWQLPSYDLPAPLESKTARRSEAEAFVVRLLDGCSSGRDTKEIKTKTAASVTIRKTTELGSVPWLFSHLKQTMHVYLFDLATVNNKHGRGSPLQSSTSCCWASEKEAEESYSMSTGMRKCWQLVTEA